MEQNKQNWWLRFKLNLKNNVTYRIISVMLVYWILGSIVLFSLFNVFVNPWKIISGFSLGCVVSLFGFLVLNLAGKWFVSKVPFKQALAYFTFLLRISVYGTIIVLAIFFKFSDLVSIISGFSLLMIATVTSEFLGIIKTKKEKKKC